MRGHRKLKHGRPKCWILYPGALGVQEVVLVLVGGLVGLSVETAIVIAIVKRLRDVAIGVPGLLVWQWTEGFRFEISPVARGLKPVFLRERSSPKSGTAEVVRSR